MASERDESTEKPFTRRDELAFSLFKAIINGRVAQGHGYQYDDPMKKDLAAHAYGLVDAFLTYRRDH